MNTGLISPWWREGSDIRKEIFPLPTTALGMRRQMDFQIHFAENGMVLCVDSETFIYTDPDEMFTMMKNKITQAVTKKDRESPWEAQTQAYPSVTQVAGSPMTKLVSYGNENETDYFKKVI